MVLLCEVLIGILIFFTGTCIFSFLNVIIYRVPKKISFIKGHSVCPACGHRLGAADLVPVWSYVFLRGKCRYCRASIGSRDTWVELMGGGLALLCAYHYENTVKALSVFAFFCILTVVAFLDMDTMEIEDGCWMAVAALTVVCVITMPEITFGMRAVGLVAVSVPMLVLTLIVEGAFGGGDIKLMAACGLFLGAKLVLVSMALAVLFGGAYGIWLLAAHKKEKKDHFAFGPFLCLGMALGILYGENILSWYTGLFITV